MIKVKGLLMILDVLHIIGKKKRNNFTQEHFPKVTFDNRSRGQGHDQEKNLCHPMLVNNDIHV